jgi:hypothetical protein
VDLGSPNDALPHSMMVSLGPLHAEIQPLHVLGEPLFAAITVAASSPHVALGPLPLPTLSQWSGAIGWVIQDVMGLVWTRTEPHPMIDRWHDSPTFDLGPGERRRILLELTQGLANPRVGDHQVYLLYADSRQCVASMPLPLQVRGPTAAEADRLMFIDAERAKAPSWDAWTRLPSAHPESLRGPFDPADPMRYLRLCRYLYCGTDPLERVDPRVVDCLGSFFAPEAALLEAEILVAHGVPMAHLAPRLLEAFPAMRWWVARLEKGMSDIAFVRGRLKI